MKVYRPVAATFPISSPWGIRRDPVTGKEQSSHYGTDFAVPVGTPVVAAIAGKIDAAGWENPQDQKQGFGQRVRQLVQVDGKPYYFYYAHLSEISVKPGDVVEAGTRVGLSGHTGKSSGPHLHFEVRPVGEKGIEVTFDA